jgi:fructokinase
MTGSDLSKMIVYALGETVLDLVTDDGSLFKAVPGGSVLNASVSLGRCGKKVQLITEYGKDKAGELIDVFLKNNHVKTDFLISNKLNKTSLALAFLDLNRNSTYSFYHDKPDGLLNIKIPEFTFQDILLFGSFYAVKPDRSSFVIKMLQKAVAANSIIYYDINIRKAHLDQIEQLMPAYLNNISAATFVKGSDEDFFYLLGITEPELIYKKIKPFCKNLIITRGEKPLCVFINGYKRTYEIPFVKPVSTIGAGDNFNAGFLYGLISYEADIKRYKAFRYVILTG